MSLLEDRSINCPRLLMLSTFELAKVLSSNGSPLSIMPAISKLFPAVEKLNLVEIKSQGNLLMGPQREEGFQIISVEDSQGETLSFCSPIPIGSRRADEWISALERATRYSLACHLTSCLSGLPQSLLGSGDASDEGMELEIFISCQNHHILTHTCTCTKQYTYTSCPISIILFINI